MSYFKNEMEPKLKPFLNLLKKEKLVEIEVELEDFHLSAKKVDSGIHNVLTDIQQIEEETLIPITSNLVGNLHLTEPKSGKPLLYEGQDITIGQLLCLIEAMNLMHEIRSPYEGKVKKVLGADGEMVEYGRPLIMLTITDRKELNGVQ